MCLLAAALQEDSCVRTYSPILENDPVVSFHFPRLAWSISTWHQVPRRSQEVFMHVTGVASSQYHSIEILSLQLPIPLNVQLEDIVAVRIHSNNVAAIQNAMLPELSVRLSDALQVHRLVDMF
jgi:hypothetical protein